LTYIWIGAIELGPHLSPSITTGGVADAGKLNVVIYEINVPDWDRSPRVPVEFRKVRKLSTALGVASPPQAYHNSENKFVFLHHIPEAYIWRL
jgi:hypothetical protein